MDLSLGLPNFMRQCSFCALAGFYWISTGLYWGFTAFHQKGAEEYNGRKCLPWLWGWLIIQKTKQGLDSSCSSEGFRLVPTHRPLCSDFLKPSSRVILHKGHTGHLATCGHPTFHLGADSVQCWSSLWVNDNNIKNDRIMDFLVPYNISM